MSIRGGETIWGYPNSNSEVTVRPCTRAAANEELPGRRIKSMSSVGGRNGSRVGVSWWQARTWHAQCRSLHHLVHLASQTRWSSPIRKPSNLERKKKKKKKRADGDASYWIP